MDHLLASLTSAQITEWMAYERLEPFGPLEEMRRAGVIAAAVLNSAFGKKKDSKVVTPEDLFPVLRKPFKPEPWQEMVEQAKTLTLAMGGEVRTAGQANG